MTKKYHLGIADMDQQHDQIFEIARKAQESNCDEISAHRLVLELVNYAQFHLKEEEAMLRSHGFHEFLETHVRLHRDFRTQVMGYYEQFRLSSSDEERMGLLRQIAVFCEHWLANHIDVEDRKYVQLLKDQKKSA